MKVISKTPPFAQGVARTLLQLKLVDEPIIAQVNERIGMDGHLIAWLNEFLRLTPHLTNASRLAQQFSLTWQVGRLTEGEWRWLTQNPITPAPLPKVIHDAPQGVLYLGKMGGGVPKLGLLDASDAQALQRMAFVFHSSFEWRLLSLDEFTTLSSYKPARVAVSANGLDEVRREGGLLSAKDVASETNDAPIVRYIHDLLTRLAIEHASDVHFEPYDKDFRIRARVDGVLREVVRPEVQLREALTVRLKIMAQLDIAEKRIPQDGRIRLKLANDSARPFIDCRVSTLPTLFGEKIVVRFLNGQDTILDLDALGFEPEQIQGVRQALAHPHGMILMTGPTGSGKTVSLYACLQQLNTEGVNISTVEDPVEIFLEGINQVAINEKAGIDFSTILRAFLRQDPDIIMVGEIRDLETADIAIKAAQTGHLVLSTLHTNSAPLALTRLMQMGVTPYNVAASVSLVVAQRLIRTLCRCKQPTRLDPRTLVGAGMDEAVASQTLWQAYAPVGCHLCHHTGYLGRVGVFEVLPISEAMQALIARHAASHELTAQAAQEGFINLRAAGLRRLIAGSTSLDEVISVTI